MGLSFSLDDILFFVYRPFSFSLFFGHSMILNLFFFLSFYVIFGYVIIHFRFFFFLSFQQQTNFACVFVTFSRKFQVPALFCNKALLCNCFTPKKVQRENFLMRGRKASLRHRDCISLAKISCLGPLFP